MITLMGEPRFWSIVHDGHPLATALADRHYSRETVGSKKFMGIGNNMVLLFTDEDGNRAVFGWRKQKIRMDNQQGVECTIFRNETNILSSVLIKEAVEIANNRWGNMRFFTYVNPSKIKSTNPGHCFMMAGWNRIGTNKNGKLVLLEYSND